MVLRQLYLHMQKNEFGAYLTPYTKINLKWIRNLNVGAKTIKLLTDNLGENLDDFGYGDAFLDAIPKTRCMKEIIDKLELIKI